MPFRSQAQRRFFYAAEARGDMPRGTARRWERETAKGRRLPEKVAHLTEDTGEFSMTPKTAAFDSGVCAGLEKVAAAGAVPGLVTRGIGAIGNWAAKNPNLAAGVGSGVLGAGIGATTAAPGSRLQGAMLGGALGGGAGYGASRLARSGWMASKMNAAAAPKQLSLF